jgi:hypothetical protein
MSDSTSITSASLLSGVAAAASVLAARPASAQSARDERGLSAPYEWN